MNLLSRRSDQTKPARQGISSMRFQIGAILFLIGFFLFLSSPSARWRVVSSLIGLQSGPTSPFVEELRRLSAASRSYNQSTALVAAIARRMETINVRKQRLVEDDVAEALAHADWYYLSGEDRDNRYQRGRLEITEGRMLSAVRRTLQQRGERLPVTVWNARRPDRSVMTGTVPPVHWKHEPPSDQTLRDLISLTRQSVADQVPEVVSPAGRGPQMRPLEAVLVAYVLMTADNGWIYPGRARVDLTSEEIRSFLSDLGIKIKRSR